MDKMLCSGVQLTGNITAQIKQRLDKIALNLFQLC